MTVARCQIVDAHSQGVYHCTARCVRRAFLCGSDAYSGHNFDHRKGWVRERLRMLAGAFGIEVYAYAVMSNHLHVVVRTLRSRVDGWDDEEIARRWLRVFPRRRTDDGQPGRPSPSEIAAMAGDPLRVAELRDRLASISWFMKSLNEFIARRANREDGCRGRFWEGRFRCQRLMDEAALLTCMTYVDLNPVRAKVVAALDAPQHTAAFERIEARQARARLAGLKRKQAARRGALTKRQLRLMDTERDRARRADWLACFNAPGSPLAHVTERAYLELLDWTGRQVRADKRGAMPPELAPILSRLHIHTERWLDTVERYGSLFHRVAGRAEHLLAEARRAGLRWLRGIRACRVSFLSRLQPG